MRKLALGSLAMAMAMAQIEQANLAGVVTDSTGAVLPGAAVTATNRNTRVRAQTKSNEAGLYRLPFLAAGEYELLVERTGFDVSKVTGIQLTVGLTATVNVTLKPGSLQQEVTVIATSVQLEQQTSGVGERSGGAANDAIAAARAEPLQPGSAGAGRAAEGRRGIRSDH